MNVTVLRAEWRAVRRATLRLMHNSLSLVGLLSVGVVGYLVTHPEYAHAVGRWILPSPAPAAGPGSSLAGPGAATVASIAGAQATAPVATGPAAVVADAQPTVADPLGGTLAHPGGEAGRMLGLVVGADGVPGGGRGLVTTPVLASRGDRSPGSRESSREKREVATYLSKKYRVNGDAIAMLVEAAYVTGRDLGLDPLLLLSVMGVESGFNPFAESTAGASGLMQLVSKVHRDKLNDFGGPNIVLNPVVNLRVGAVVLKDCIRRGGSIVDGLRLYVGAGTSSDSGYGARVLQEKDRLQQAVRRRCGFGSCAPDSPMRPRSRHRPPSSRLHGRTTAPTRPRFACRTAVRDAATDHALGSRVDPKQDAANDPDHGRFAAL